jgi:small subunit ribosomal protein S17
VSTKKNQRGTSRVLAGTVTSTKMDKTIVVTVIRRFRDRRFHKFVVRRQRYKAHDEHGQAQLGDFVEVVESRPYSATKRFRYRRTLEKAREAAQ